MQYNVFLRPSKEIISTNGAIPNDISRESIDITATALYSKFCRNDTIDKAYVDAANLLATTIDGFEFLRLLLQHTHALLSVKNIATIAILRYSTYRSLFPYAREIKAYVSNQNLKDRSFDDKEVTHIFLSHLDDPNYANVVDQIHQTRTTTLRHSLSVFRGSQV